MYHREKNPMNDATQRSRAGNSKGGKKWQEIRRKKQRQRRKKVEILLKDHTQVDIAKMLGVSTETIRLDVKAIRSQNEIGEDIHREDLKE